MPFQFSLKTIEKKLNVWINNNQLKMNKIVYNLNKNNNVDVKVTEESLDGVKNDIDEASDMLQIACLALRSCFTVNSSLVKSFVELRTEFIIEARVCIHKVLPFANAEIQKIAIHLRLALSSISFYGITKDPETCKYVMVLKYLKDENLRNHLNNNFNNISWHNRLNYLVNLAHIFKEIHKLDIIHQDFHPGNILLLSNFHINQHDLYISDFGLSKLIGENEETPQKRNVFGVLSYIAPEGLSGNKEYIKAADVYSFAIIAYEIVTGFQPYPDVPHDDELALKICNGLRPKIPFQTPKLITQIIMRCWDARISHRFTFEELYEKLNEYYCDYMFKDNDKNNIEIIIQNEDKEIFKNQTTTDTTPLYYKTHPQAIYTSRLLNFQNLPKPVNEPDFEKKT
ncbi:hypothetical protein Glove_97g54 [Diversispora epigaea]|uniref:Protein kinase domain-containing protein n=1 Tax=Diversispora epigaea TaxID=1348612 RepID=A0A397J7A5_9GLOM|nr:hypothetical protein Glove_97g54 [Diversispora epigaea]